MNGQEKIFSANSNKEKKAGMARLLTDKIDVESKIITGDKEGHYILIKQSIHQEDIKILQTCHVHLTTEPKNI